MITGFNHSGFVVRDLQKMVAFYRDVLGLKVMREVDATKPPLSAHVGIEGAQRYLVFVGKDSEQHQLELVYYLQPKSPDTKIERHNIGAAHVCFNVKGLDKMYEELSKKGVKFAAPLVTRETPTATVRICYGQDPEGNWLEFIENIPK